MSEPKYDVSSEPSIPRREVDEGPAPPFGPLLWAPRLDDPDAAIRSAAFGYLHRIVDLYGTVLPWVTINTGFMVTEERVYFATQAEGIFSPRQMKTLLSIKTVIPRPGRSTWYSDQINAPGIVKQGQALKYAFRGKDPDSHQNVLLRQAMDLELPVIYFFGVAPGLYEVVFPVFITGWRGEDLSVDLELSVPEVHGDPLSLPSSIEERRYAARTVRQRLHQSVFRSKVLAAYRRRCSLSRLKVTSLIDAAHIIPDNNPEYGQPDVRNGLCLSRLHHAAFDSGLIGIDPDYKIHIALPLMKANDGPMLEHLKQLHGRSILPPRERSCWPDKDRLALRFEQFRLNERKILI